MLFVMTQFSSHLSNWSDRKVGVWVVLGAGVDFRKGAFESKILSRPQNMLREKKGSHYQ
jgi:hypothetical protein